MTKHLPLTIAILIPVTARFVTGDGLQFGYIQDILFSFFVFSILIRFSEIGMVLFCTMNLAYLADRAYILDRGTHINFSALQLNAIDSTFLFGSMTEVYFFDVVALVLLAVAAVTWSPRKLPKTVTIVSFTMLAVSVVHTLKSSDWRDENVFISNLKYLLPTSTEKASTTKLNIFKQDFSGESIIKKHAKAKNVLRILGESMSQSYLDDLDSDIRLKNWNTLNKQRRMVYNNFYALQRGTNRGTYAILCGDYPGLIRSSDKWQDVLDGKLKRKCLPSILKENGFHTEYIQAANLSYLGKDKLLPKYGFTKLLGNKSFTNPIMRNGWGVDDKTLFKKVRERISQIKSPWFMVVLNVGTHHPYDIAPNLSNKSKRVSSFLHYDNMLMEFVEGLKSDGVLEDTLVFLTSDEPGIIPRRTIERSFAESKIPLTILTPSLETVYNQGEFHQGDLALSILDYLDLDPGSEIFGRSIFRRYRTRRHILLGNKWNAVVKAQMPNGDLVDCSMHARFCDGTDENIKEVRSIISRLDSSKPLAQVSKCEKLRPDQLIAHAGGRFEGQIYTNSIEALSNSYSKGHRYFEIDFNWTIDGHLVLLHDWDKNLFPLFGTRGRLKASHFKNLNMVVNAKPADIVGLVKWLETHPDAYVVTDVKNGNTQALQLFAYKYGHISHQIIPQIYVNYEYQVAKDMGFDDIIFALYRMRPDDLAKFTFRNDDLFGVSVKARRFLNPASGVASFLKKTGVPIFVHPISNPCSANYLVKEHGVAMVYSHDLSPE